MQIDYLNINMVERVEDKLEEEISIEVKLETTFTYYEELIALRQ